MKSRSTDDHALENYLNAISGLAGSDITCDGLSTLTTVGHKAMDGVPLNRVSGAETCSDKICVQRTHCVQCHVRRRRRRRRRHHHLMHVTACMMWIFGCLLSFEGC
jgi:hypothetical protein